jgi:hypothetical protein
MFGRYVAILRCILCRKLFRCTVFLADKALIRKLKMFTVKIMMKIEVDN